MATPEAAALTRQFHAEVLRVAALLAQRVRRAALRADPADIDTWWVGVSPQIRREIQAGQSATARLARQYLRQHGAAEGVRVDPDVVELPAAQVVTSLDVTGPVAFKTHMAESGSEAASVRTMATTLEGSATRLVMEGGRSTVMRSFSSGEIFGWRRAGTGRICPFCQMLIGRGAVYRGSTVSFRAHDHCHCVAIPVYRREREPPEVRRLQAQWREATAGASGEDAVRAWREYWTQRQTGG